MGYVCTLRLKEALFEGQQYIWMIRLINSVSQYTEISSTKAQCYAQAECPVMSFLFRHRLDKDGVVIHGIVC